MRSKSNAKAKAKKQSSPTMKTTEKKKVQKLSQNKFKIFGGRVSVGKKGGKTVVALAKPTISKDTPPLAIANKSEAPPAAVAAAGAEKKMAAAGTIDDDVM